MTMKKNCKLVSKLAAALAASTLFAAGAFAQTTTNITILPATPGVSATITPVAMDAAPGFAYGSFAHKGTLAAPAKSEIYLTPMALFGREIKIGEIESISYWTKNRLAQTGTSVDWFLAIYTKPYQGDVSTPGWYGDRYGSEPYFSASLNAPANTWNQWTTDIGENQLRFFESTQGAPGANLGTYGDLAWSGFKAANALSTQPRGAGDLLYFSIQTASNWSFGFNGQLDGLRIGLTDGSVVNVNFEPFLVASTRDVCKKDGWKTLLRGDGSAFNSQGDCVSFVNTQK